MAASYPGAVRTFTTKENMVSSVDASDPNFLQEEVVSVEQTLGLNPHVGTNQPDSATYDGSGATFASVSARLTNLEKGVVGDNHTQYVKKAGGSVVSITGVGVVGLQIQGASGQTADLIRLTNNTPTTLFSINNVGAIIAPLAGHQFGATPSGLASVPVIAIKGRSTTESPLTLVGFSAGATAPILSLYQDTALLETSIDRDGALRASVLSVGTAKLLGTLAIIGSTGIGTTPLVLKGFSGQSADMLKITDSTGTSKTRVMADGSLTVGTAVDNGGAVNIGASTARPGLVIKSSEIPATTTIMTQWTGNDGENVANVNSYGTGAFKHLRTIAAPDVLDVMAYFVGNASAKRALVVQASTGQSVDIMQVLDEAGTARFKVTSTGNVRVNGATSGGTVGIKAPDASTIPLTIETFSGQTLPLTRWQDASGTSVATVKPDGTMTGTFLGVSSPGTMALDINNPGLIVGTGTGRNMAFNTASIQGRNNGVKDDVKVNPLGGNVLLGDATSTTTMTGKTATAALAVNAHNIFVQSTTPVGAVDGDVWIQI